MDRRSPRPIARTAAIVGLGGLASILAAGCSSSGPIQTHRAKLGSLETTVSQLEYANENLRKQVATLKADQTHAENELAQERDANDDLSGRLDDARQALKSQGIDSPSLARGASARPSRAADDDDVPPPVSTPSVRRSKSSRPAPAASIPRRQPPTETNGAGEWYDPGPQTSRPKRPTTDTVAQYQARRDTLPRRDALARRDSYSAADDDLNDSQWLPVARGDDASARRYR